MLVKAESVNPENITQEERDAKMLATLNDAIGVVRGKRGVSICVLGHHDLTEKSVSQGSDFMCTCDITDMLMTAHAAFATASRTIMKQAVDADDDSRSSLMLLVVGVDMLKRHTKDLVKILVPDPRENKVEPDPKAEPDKAAAE